MSELFTETVDHDLVERASALRPLLERNAALCEQERRITDDNLAAIDDADLFATLVPKRVGGQGASLATQLAVSAELGQGCASTAWVQTLVSVTTWAASLLVQEGQAEIFATERPPRVCGVLTPTGTAALVDGDSNGETNGGGLYRVTGRWGFASGSLHADWATCGVHVLDHDGQTVSQDVALIPMDQLTVDDTWFVAGMRGTGSNTLVADDVYVPAHRFGFLGHATGTPTKPADQGPSDAWPLGGTLALVLVGPMLGVVEAALASVVAKAPKRAISYTSFEHQTDSSVVLTEIARASLELDTARMHTFRAAADIDTASANGAPLDPVALGRIRGACGYASETLRGAMDRLINVGGASSFAEVSSLQRNWRDLNVGSRHAFVATNPVLEVYGRAMFGLHQIMELV
jgi:3-hydroxy-9,10-secoandrosta-1,3,5(10)-triene-9,17-dione monooxygenase